MAVAFAEPGVAMFAGRIVILVGAAVVFAKLELLPGVIGAPEEWYKGIMEPEELGTKPEEEGTTNPEETAVPPEAAG